MQNKSAFTLIELILLIALVAIIASIVVSSSSFVNRFMVRAQAEKLAATCRYLRQLAMSTHTEQKIIFDVPGNSYTIQSSIQSGGQLERLPSQIQFGVGNRIILGPPSAPANQITQPVTYHNQEIIFYPDGIISSGLVYLSDTSGKYVYAMSSPISGVSFLRTYVYDGTWNLLK